MPASDALKAQRKREHYEKYERLARWLGIETIKSAVIDSIDPGRIRAATAQGDEHLNMIPLHLWDRLHGASGGV
ncbi:MAG: hypothetical protein HN420_16940, partial [Rhodospirillaceae bacterium]|nr:hypothetical protein [Rhodospirillaceae bacterium]